MDNARTIAARIRGILGSRAASLIPIPEIENDPTPDAIRKLQVQIFELSDAVAELAAEVDRLRGAAHEHKR